MLKCLHLRNFTVFENAEFAFGPGLNVLVGANGTGKSHVLKVGYTMLSSLSGWWFTGTPIDDNTRARMSANLGMGIMNIFQPSFSRDFKPLELRTEELIRRGAGATKSMVELVLTHPDAHLKFSIPFSEYSAAGSKIADSVATESDNKVEIITPVFIPAKEVLTMGWLLPLYDLRKLPIDQTYPDLLRLLAVPQLRLPTPNTLNIEIGLAHLIGGGVEEEGGHYFLSGLNQPRMEMNMVAEGVRKFATLYKLLANGTLTPETTLFWDEPEANLNPALLKDMAAVLTELAKAGFQIILATHSLFLLKELHILAQREHKPVRYFGLSAEPGAATTVATADNLELLPDIVALDAELDQSDRFQRVLDQEDADSN